MDNFGNDIDISKKKDGDTQIINLVKILFCNNTNLNIIDTFNTLCTLYDDLSDIDKINNIIYVKYIFSIYFKIYYNYNCNKDIIQQYKKDKSKYDLFLKTFFNSNLKGNTKLLEIIKKFYDTSILLKIGGYKKYKIINYNR